MTISVHDTIADGKRWLLSQLGRGAQCPLCDQHAQVYRRKINAGMAKSLIRMHRSAGQGWVHVSVIGAGSREEGKLAYWGLVEEQKGLGLHGGRAGYWRVTQKGEAFLNGHLKVPMYAKIYNGKVLGFEGDPVTIKDALGTDFNYQDLMQGV